MKGVLGAEGLQTPLGIEGAGTDLGRVRQMRLEAGLALIRVRFDNRPRAIRSREGTITEGMTIEGTIHFRVGEGSPEGTLFLPQDLGGTRGARLARTLLQTGGTDSEGVGIQVQAILFSHLEAKARFHQISQAGATIHLTDLEGGLRTIHLQVTRLQKVLFLEIHKIEVFRLRAQQDFRVPKRIHFLEELKTFLAVTLHQQ